MKNSYTYSSIGISSPEFSSYSLANTHLLTGLSRINLFIGPNNSGKSRFLRAIFASKEIKFTCNGVDLVKINSSIKNLKEEIINFYTNNFISSIQGVNYGDLDEIDLLTSSIDLKTIYDTINNFKVNSVTTSGRYGGGADINSAQRFFTELKNKYLSELELLKHFEKNEFKRENIYIPTLRGLRSFTSTSNSKNYDSYAERTKKDYFPDIEKVEDRIFTGLSLYDDIKRLLLGPNQSRQKIRDFEAFLSKNFFNNNEFNIIPNIDHDVVNVKIGDDEYPIYQLGEGIQAIIVLTYPLFFNQGQNITFFYEEPDLFLHPGFQRVFIETLMLPQFSTFQYFLTTHSNHFLDMTLDFEKISVYTFQKQQNNYLIDNVENAEKNILELLGIRNSSVFLTNCTIWVEGITDRIYIRKYLELFQRTQNKVFSEDIHYSFVEYGGNNITHWSFLDDIDKSHPNISVENLCSKLFLITDSDNPKPLKNGEESEKMKRQKYLTKSLGERYYCLRAREIENLLDIDAIIAVIEDYEDNTNLDFKKLKNLKYRNEPLGRTIEKNIMGLKKRYSGDNGAIRSSLKLEFAKRAVTYCNDFTSLTNEAQELSAKIYNFIKKNNL